MREWDRVSSLKERSLWVRDVQEIDCTTESSKGYPSTDHGLWSRIAGEDGTSEEASSDGVVDIVLGPILLQCMCRVSIVRPGQDRRIVYSRLRCSIRYQSKGRRPYRNPFRFGTCPFRSP